MYGHFEQVPLVGSGTDPVTDIDRWLAAEPVHQLVGTFAANRTDQQLASDLATGHGSAEDRLKRLDAFTARWDTRKGLERNQAPELPLTQEQDKLVLAAAHALGIRGGARLRFQRYDHVVILGGLIRACLARPAYAAHLIHTGTVQAGAVTALGGHRPFVGNEFELAAQAGAPELTEEYEALDHGTRRAFDLGDPQSVEGETSPLPGGTWGVRTYRTADDLPVRVAAAPSRPRTPTPPTPGKALGLEGFDPAGPAALSQVPPCGPLNPISPFRSTSRHPHNRLVTITASLCRSRSD